MKTPQKLNAKSPISKKYIFFSTLTDWIHFSRKSLYFVSVVLLKIGVNNVMLYSWLLVDALNYL